MPQKTAAVNFIGCSRKSQLGFGLGLLILAKTETQWIFRNFVFCKAELPPKTREKTDYGLAQFVLLRYTEYLSNSLHTPR